MNVSVRLCVRVYVCLSVRVLREHISGTTRPIFTQFLIFVHATHGRASILRRR